MLLFGFCLFVLKNIPSTFTEQTSKTAIESIGNQILRSHEMEINEGIRSLIRSKVSLDDVSFLY